eukprot:1370787-Prymnesium_polylepis.1
MRTDLLEDESVVGVGREPSHAPLRSYDTVDAALRQPLCDREIPRSRWVVPLTPAEWAFHLADQPSACPAVLRETGGFEGVSSWATIAVPKSWELAGFSRPLYTNVRYPFALDPPRVPRDERNPTGCYQRDFTLPADWAGRRVVLHLDGVSSALTAFVDGVELGYSEDSRLPVEFDLTAAIARAGRAVAGTHTLSVAVQRWCSGSYLEDQDQWWLSGIARHCWVYAKPAAASICDYA